MCSYYLRGNLAIGLAAEYYCIPDPKTPSFHQRLLRCFTALAYFLDGATPVDANLEARPLLGLMAIG